MARVAVIGGGISGLGTALMLGRRGHTVTLFEQDARQAGKDLNRDVFHWDRPRIPQAVQLNACLAPHLRRSSAGCPGSRRPPDRAGRAASLHPLHSQGAMRTKGARSLHAAGATVTLLTAHDAICTARTGRYARRRRPLDGYTAATGPTRSTRSTPRIERRQQPRTDLRPREVR
ncbi:FAD-dependent oxidoreductase [Streptomyces sp. NPDC015127]|uniref:FAD-dependent oxidoreductase n=1 Tax=Streptomyces sp. NPDC015127 TaxID=3364939 RepID=UPI0036FCEDAE